MKKSSQKILKSTLNKFITTGLLLVGMLVSAETHAAPPAEKKAAPAATARSVVPGKGASEANKGFRKKELNFEERVIEGLSNKGYDSLSQSGTADGLKGEKLYRKRAEFDDDSKAMLREMEYLK